MIVLDTNVVSEMMRAAPNRSVVTWLNAENAAAIFITTVTIAEMMYGLASLPLGKRRTRLEQGFEGLISGGFVDRVLAFDAPAAREYGAMMSHRKRLGRPMSVLDGQIGAIARSHRMALATRNARDFEACELDLINPFEA